MEKLRVFLIVFMVCATAFNGVAQPLGSGNSALTVQEWVIAKNYYVSFLLSKEARLLSEVVNTAEIKALLNGKKKVYSQATDCDNLDCYIKAFQWSQTEITQLTNSLVKRFDADHSFRKFIEDSLANSNKYGLQGDATLVAYFRKALEQDFKAVNYAIEVYGGGKNPNYPKIDSISFDTQHKSYLSVLKDVHQDVSKDQKSLEDLFFLPLTSAVRFLEINERWDAALLEPLEENENRLAYEKVKTTNWDDYPYTSLLVLGAGPSRYDQPISPGGILRTRMAARAYHDGLVPFVIVSGGRVHPYKTPHIEAVQMKKYLMNIHNVPESAIIIEPHARHTTTNMRNASRIMINYGFPVSKMALVGSSVAHINSVEKMDDRCIGELGYVPYALGKRVNDVLLEFMPKTESLTIDWNEPLDP